MSVVTAAISLVHLLLAVVRGLWNLVEALGVEALRDYPVTLGALAATGLVVALVARRQRRRGVIR